MLHSLLTTTTTATSTANNPSASMTSAGKRPVDLSPTDGSDPVKRLRSHLSPEQDPQPDEEGGRRRGRSFYPPLLLLLQPSTSPTLTPPASASLVSYYNAPSAWQWTISTTPASSFPKSLSSRPPLAPPPNESARTLPTLSRRASSALTSAPTPPSPPYPNLTTRNNALQIYNSITPLIKFSHFTANQAIQQAVDGADHVHVIDLDIMQGLQWPGLFHILASKSRKLKSFRITGLGSSAELLSSTGQRLSEFASALSIPFQFQPLKGKLATERGKAHSGAAVVGCEIRNIVAVGGPKRTGEVKVERWRDELVRVGFRPVSLAGNPAAQANLLLGMSLGKGTLWWRRMDA
ncbi:UNVERIFIED_CONTAM: Scarecrow-like protein 23 [Sesamum radiatum]|uniref:Scarecrow-like protein 23 n=1 Tax=Sesamum radiatum TaxID=300843 RepID=A0AAW2KM96_SESRA